MVSILWQDQLSFYYTLTSLTLAPPWMRTLFLGREVSSLFLPLPIEWMIHTWIPPGQHFTKVEWNMTLSQAKSECLPKTNNILLSITVPFWTLTHSWVQLTWASRRQTERSPNRLNSCHCVSSTARPLPWVFKGKWILGIWIMQLSLPSNFIRLLKFWSKLTNQPHWNNTFFQI